MLVDVRPLADEPHTDHFVWLHDISWPEYERILKVRGDHSAPRISYLDGTLQILNPSDTHEILKSTIGRLVEEWCLEHDIEFTTVGSWTIKEKTQRRGVEPDECYIFGPVGKAARPDLAIEVIWTSGGINKLEIYRNLGVAEVWICRHGELKPYVLRGEEYEAVSESEKLPGIDLPQIASLLDQPTTSAAIRAYRELLRQE